jgi:chaperonin GroES
MIQLEPSHDRIVIKRSEEVEETRGGLYIPDTTKEKPQQGEVKAPR